MKGRQTHFVKHIKEYGIYTLKFHLIISVCVSECLFVEQLIYRLKFQMSSSTIFKELTYVSLFIDANWSNGRFHYMYTHAILKLRKGACMCVYMCVCVLVMRFQWGSTVPTLNIAYEV